MPFESEKKQLLERVAKLVQERYSNNYKIAFDHYDRKPKDGKISIDELIELLADANVGNWITRSRWADAIMSELDSDKDGSISWNEFNSVLK